MKRASSLLVMGFSLTLVMALAPTGPASAACGDTWTVSEDGAIPAYWQDVAIVDATHAWAVGFDDNDHLAIASWNGSTWTDATPALFPSSTESHLSSILAIGADDVWAVGDVVDPSTNTLRALILHKTATGWAIDAEVDPGRYPRFESVWGDGSGDLWAVGETKAGGRFVGLTYHRVGADWVRVGFPRLDGVEMFLHGISGSGPDVIWAVGEEASVSITTRPIAFHWTGNGWDRTPLPTLPHTELTAAFHDVAAADPTHVWAVGYFAIGRRMLLERWDGSAWQRVYIPDQHGRESLFGVAAASTTKAFVVGYEDLYTAVVRTWNGHRWSAAQVPDVRAQLKDVAAKTGVGAFAVGSHDYGWIVAACA